MKYITQLLLFLLISCGYATAQVMWSQHFSGLTANSDVVINNGENIVLDEKVTINSLRIMEGASLRCKPGSGTDIAISAQWIESRGTFECGLPGSPFEGKFDIELRGPRIPESSGGFYDNKALAVLEGTLDFHGAPRTPSWTNLDVTAQKGATAIVLREAVNWRVGDRIAISSTDYEMYQAEEFTIVAVTHGGLRLELDAPLQYMHFGEVQHYDNGKGLTWQLDERAEVAVLTRQIVVRGDDANAAAPNNEVGGHVIVTQNGVARFSNVELTKAGHRAELGRYPIHYHLRGDTSGTDMYVRDCVVHHALNRCYTIHGTSNLLVQGNVCYNTWGHGFFIEDGDEVGNTFAYNLAFVIKEAPSSGLATIPTDENTVSAFWITNPDNTFEYNVAGGSDHAGFWMALPDAPVKFGAGSPLKPRRTAIRKFDNNKGHSSRFSNFAIDGQPHPNTLDLINGHYAPLNNPSNPSSGKLVQTLHNFTSYKCAERGIWIRSDTLKFENFILADSYSGSLLAFNNFLIDSLVVGISANVGNPQTDIEKQMGHTSGRPNNGVGGTHFNGHPIYDGPTFNIRTHFAGFHKSYSCCMQAVGAATKSTTHTLIDVTYASDIPMQNRLCFGGNARPSEETIWSSGVIDKDGSLTGVANTIIVGRPDELRQNSQRYSSHENHPCLTGVAECQNEPRWGANICRNVRVGHVQMFTNTANKNFCAGPPSYSTAGCSGFPGHVIRSDGDYVSTAFMGPVEVGYHQFAVVSNKQAAFSYRLVQPKQPYKQEMRYRFNEPGDTVLVELANVPSSFVVSQAGQVGSRAALLSASATSYWREGNDLHIKMVATGNSDYYEDESGAAHYGASSHVKVCHNNNCYPGTDQRFQHATLADFENQLDPRGSVMSTAAGVQHTAAQHVDAGNDDYVQFTVSSLNDGQDGYADYFMNFGTQTWRLFGELRIDMDLSCSACASQPTVAVYIEDRDEGYTQLPAVPKASGRRTVTLALPVSTPEKIDRVFQVRVRVNHADFVPAKSGSPSAVQTVKLFALTLHDNNAPTFWDNQARVGATTDNNCELNVASWVPPVPDPQFPTIVSPTPRLAWNVNSNQVTGWCCDYDNDAMVSYVDIYVNGQLHDSMWTDVLRNDLANVKECLAPLVHGFVYRWDANKVQPSWSSSQQTIKVVCRNVNDGEDTDIGTKMSTIGGSTVQAQADPPPVPGRPVGAIDVAAKTYVSGWACDEDANGAPIHVTVRVDGLVYATVLADEARVDLATVPECGGQTAHGFSIQWDSLLVQPAWKTTPANVEVIAENVGFHANSLIAAATTLIDPPVSTTPNPTPPPTSAGGGPTPPPTPFPTVMPTPPPTPNPTPSQETPCAHRDRSTCGDCLARTDCEWCDSETRCGPMGATPCAETPLSVCPTPAPTDPPTQPPTDPPVDAPVDGPVTSDNSNNGGGETTDDTDFVGSQSDPSGGDALAPEILFALIGLAAACVLLFTVLLFVILLRRSRGRHIQSASVAMRSRSRGGTGTRRSSRVHHSRRGDSAQYSGQFQTIGTQSSGNSQMTMMAHRPMPPPPPAYY